jgi:hypothetical protein
MLNLAEELILIAINDETGEFHRMASLNFNLALVGALVMDLAIQEKIDVQDQVLKVVDPKPGDDPFLNEVLDAILQCEAPIDCARIIRYLHNNIERLKERLLSNLEAKGIVSCRESKFLWLFNTRRYPVLDNREEMEALTRIRTCVIDNQPPTNSDLALIALIDICDLMDKIFSREELARYEERIEILRSLDYIGHAINRIIADVQLMITSTFIT